MQVTSEQFTVAAVQAAPVFLDRDATVMKACALIQKAAQHHAQLVVFPETWIPTYPFWIWGNAESARKRRVFTQLFKNAVEIPSAQTDQLCEAARDAGAYVVLGVNELDTEFGRGTLYNTLLFIDRQGHIFGKHRKLVPTDLERTVWGRGDGSTLQVYETELGRIGGLICWENHMPLARYTLYAQGEQIHIATWPTGGYGPSCGDYTLRQIAFEGQCFVISTGAFIEESLIPDSFDLKEETNWTFWTQSQGSIVIAPDGEYVAGPLPWREDILYADIDLTRIPLRKQLIDVAGHYARPDVFKLHVNREKHQALHIERLDIDNDF